MTKRIFKNTLTIAALVALNTAGFAAVSAKQSEYRSATVEHGDLNLSKGRDRARLNSRIKIAVAKVCGRFPGLRTGADREHRKCMIEAHESARRAKEIAVMDAQTVNPKQTDFAMGN